MEPFISNEKSNRIYFLMYNIHSQYKTLQMIYNCVSVTQVP